jgi:hypothetical protein
MHGAARFVEGRLSLATEVLSTPAPHGLAAQFALHSLLAMTVSSIFEDLSHFDRFKRNVSQNASFGPTDLKVEVLDYLQGKGGANHRTWIPSDLTTIHLDNSQPQKRTASAPDLATLPLPPLRIMLTPILSSRLPVG